jgi:hypothetical protein
MNTLTKPSSQAVIDTGKLRAKMITNRAAYDAAQKFRNVVPQAALGVGRNIVDSSTVGKTANDFVTKFPYQNPQYKEKLGAMFPAPTEGYSKGGAVGLRRGGQPDFRDWMHNKATIGDTEEESPQDALFNEKSNAMQFHGGENSVALQEMERLYPETYRQRVLSGEYDDELHFKKGGKIKLGMVKGPGTETSDSIPAKLSKGEFVVPANVVDAYGVDFFNNLVKKVTGSEPPPPDIKNGEVHAFMGFSPGGIFNPYVDEHKDENDINKISRENIGAGVRNVVDTAKQVPVRIGSAIKNAVNAIDEQGYSEGEQYRKGYQGKDFVPNATQESIQPQINKTIAAESARAGKLFSSPQEVQANIARENAITGENPAQYENRTGQKLGQAGIQPQTQPKLVNEQIKQPEQQKKPKLAQQPQRQQQSNTPYGTFENGKYIPSTNPDIVDLSGGYAPAPRTGGGLKKVIGWDDPGPMNRNNMQMYTPEYINAVANMNQAQTQNEIGRYGIDYKERELNNSETVYSPGQKVIDALGNQVITNPSIYNKRTGEYKVLGNDEGQQDAMDSQLLNSPRAAELDKLFARYKDSNEPVPESMNPALTEYLAILEARKRAKKRHQPTQ